MDLITGHSGLANPRLPVHMNAHMAEELYAVIELGRTTEISAVKGHRLTDHMNLTLIKLAKV